MAAYYVGAVRGSEPRTCPVVSLWNRPQDGTSQPEGVVNASFPWFPGSALEPRGFRRWQRASVALLPPLLRVGVRVDGVGQNPWHTTIASKPKAETSCICSFPHRRASPRAIVWGGCSGSGDMGASAAPVCASTTDPAWAPAASSRASAAPACASRLRRGLRHELRRLRHEPLRPLHVPRRLRRGSGTSSGGFAISLSGLDMCFDGSGVVSLGGFGMCFDGSGVGPGGSGMCFDGSGVAPA